jgi:hypothetical protein
MSPDLNPRLIRNSTFSIEMFNSQLYKCSYSFIHCALPWMGDQIFDKPLSSHAENHRNRRHTSSEILNRYPLSERSPGSVVH